MLKVGIMDPELWGTLADEVVLLILARLPVCSFLKFRLVCKKWNRLADDADFQRSFRRNGCQPPLFITRTLSSSNKSVRHHLGNCNSATLHHFGTYNAASDVWLDQLPPFLSDIRTASLLATAGGLILCMTGECMFIEGVNNRKLFVSNPLTKSKKLLPSMIHHTAASRLLSNDKLDAWLSLESKTNRYNVLVIHRFYNLSEVYDSKKDAWETRGGVPLFDFSQSSTALFKGKLYTLGLVHSWGPCSRLSLYRIDALGKKMSSEETQHWHEIAVDLMVKGVDMKYWYLYENDSHLTIAVMTKMEMIISQLDVDSETLCKLHKVHRQESSYHCWPAQSGYILRAYEDYIFQIVFPNFYGKPWTFEMNYNPMIGNHDDKITRTRRIRVPTDFMAIHGKGFLFEPRLDLFV